jgi:hypothetical protein
MPRDSKLSISRLIMVQHEIFFDPYSTFYKDWYKRPFHATVPLKDIYRKLKFNRRRMRSMTQKMYQSVESEPVFVIVYGAQESIQRNRLPPSYVARRAGTKNRVFVLARQAGNRFLGSSYGLQGSGQCSGTYLL